MGTETRQNSGGTGNENRNDGDLSLPGGSAGRVHGSEIGASRGWCLRSQTDPSSGDNQDTAPPDGGPEYNRLVFEKSPYLLQHAGNPVDWYPWGEAAFEKARRENKPIFLSIGYSTCHWCHVMEHESFEDPEVAKLMNEHFVSIKVDREEPPDVDNIYMTVCQAMSGSGGWPLTIVMTPEKRPFFAGTYFPKESRFGRAGMLDLIPKLAEAWRTRRDELLANAERATSYLQRTARRVRHAGQQVSRSAQSDLPAALLET